MPPAQGMPLGLRLGLTTSIIVILVLGTLMVLHQARESRRELKAREDLLEESLLPLASDIERASTIEEMRRRLFHFQQSYILQGHPDHQVVLRDSNGTIVASTLPNRASHLPSKGISASLPVVSSLLEGGNGTLTVWQDGSEFYADVSQRWRFLWIALGITILCILLSLQAANHFLIAKPVGKLLEGVRKMEMGYWGTLEVPRGAWEMRWLAWKFRNLGVDLEKTMHRLVDAERRVLESSRSQGGMNGQEIGRVKGGGELVNGKNSSLRHEMERHYLQDKCRLLESLTPGNPASLRMAREAWDLDSLAAERLGENLLRTRLENSALRILEPEIYRELSRRVQEEVSPARQKWIEQRERDITEKLEEQGIPCLSVHHRVKHLGGIRRKMQAKSLTFEEVYDLFAFRIIVPGEEECYLALDAVHRMFTPQMLRFKDYIAHPKPNGYQSIHTSLVDGDGNTFEVQIRSAEMHRQAEPDHWQYRSSSALHAGEAGRTGGVLNRVRSILRSGSEGRGK